MKHYLRFSGLMLGLALATGCGGKLEPPPVTTEQEMEELDTAMEDSMAAGEAAAAAAAGGGTAPSGGEAEPGGETSP
jgi:hypothetical protein